MADQGQKTEQPTERRLQKARKEGQFPSSRDFVSAVQFAGFLALAAACGPAGFEHGRRWMRALLAASFHTELDLNGASRIVFVVARQLMVPLFGAGLLLALLTLATQLATTRLGLSAKRLVPDVKRLNPASRLKNMARQNVSHFFQALALLPLFCYAVWVVASANAAGFLRMPQMGLEVGLGLLAASLSDLMWKAAGLFLVIGLIDLVRQRRRWKKDLRMSKQDIREELKEVEGDPYTRMRIRRMQRELARRKMMSDVATATAVVVNPTHYAVALRYVPAEMPAPAVVAKGKNYLAARIRDIARSHQVPIIENPPLAQALYKSAEVGQEIPAHLYRAVAEVLAYIFRIMNPRVAFR